MIAFAVIHIGFLVSGFLVDAFVGSASL
jgi:hypothetical protein